jgi:hypothetical protein
MRSAIGRGQGLDWASAARLLGELLARAHIGFALLQQSKRFRRRKIVLVIDSEHIRAGSYRSLRSLTEHAGRIDNRIYIEKTCSMRRPLHTDVSAVSGCSSRRSDSVSRVAHSHRTAAGESGRAKTRSK